MIPNMPAEPPRVRLTVNGESLMDSTGTWEPAQVERAIKALQNPTQRTPGRNILFAGLLDVLTGNTEQWTVTKTKIGDAYHIDLETKAAG
ncbi:hypothetical protein I5I01_gp93 [Mycobacterium phage MooMoo]|uniref:Uncharacterized protein n=1 Tax=Mycobacterium phage MooMoo TaxID=2108127 RepID=A0A2P1JRB4_9CAUD|nr:hypothetical protein I5I01_gp93 [Mycobacterium phage MooMoo]AVO21698.1 hypothetical protein SEA_MOOMOO_93 [Mycobacterium phage MooMoo]